MSDDNLADAMAEIQKMKKGIVEVQRLGEAIADENESLRTRLSSALALIKVKDEALRRAADDFKRVDYPGGKNRVEAALSAKLED